MRDLCTRMNIQGINVQLSTFSKANKVREIAVFEKIIVELNKRLSNKKGVEKARALFPIDSTVITLTSKLLWQEKWHQVKLFCGLNSMTSEVGGIVIHFGQGHDSKEGKETIASIPENSVEIMDRGFAAMKRIKELLGNKGKDFVLRMNNNITLEMLENGKCKVGKGKDAVEVRVVMFCDLEERTEFRLATDLPDEGEGAVSNEEIAEIYVQRWQIECGNS